MIKICRECAFTEKQELVFRVGHITKNVCDKCGTKKNGVAIVVTMPKTEKTGGQK